MSAESPRRLLLSERREGGRLYLPDRQRLLGIAVWKEMVRELLGARGLIWRLARRDISARYRQSIFGVLWAVFTPVALMATFVLLKGSGLVKIRDTDVPYPLFIYSGLLPWQLFARCLSGTTRSLTGEAELLRKVNFPREALVVSKVGQALFGFLVASVVLAGLFAYYRVAPAWTVVFYPLLLLLLAVFAVGLGFGLALLEAAVRDVGNALAVVTMAWLLLTPVAYAPATTWPRCLLNWLNPMSPIITASRDLLLRGSLTMPRELAFAALLCVLIALVSWRVFHLLEPKIAERI